MVSRSMKSSTLKASKFHLKFSFLFAVADIKKHAQELYALINYGEMRKKLVFVNAKACMKLKELVYHGSVSIRVKGKNIRIKTPSCKALRQLNQMEGKKRVNRIVYFSSFWSNCLSIRRMARRNKTSIESRCIPEAS